MIPEKRILIRELRLMLAKPTSGLMPVLFFFMIMTLVPFSMSISQVGVSPYAPGFIWIAAILSILLKADQFFVDDLREGITEQWILLPSPFVWLISVKLFAIWFIHIFPLLFAIPLVLIWFSIPNTVFIPFFAAILIASPALTCYSAIGAVLATGVAESNLLGIAVVLPFFIPLIVLGSGILERATEGTPVMPLLALLSSLSLIVMALTPWVISQILKMHIEDL